MPDITLTITMPEDLARRFAADTGHWATVDGRAWAAASAIASALPPEPPKQGERWRHIADGGLVWAIGPQWRDTGWFLVCDLGSTTPTVAHASEILATMERVR